MASLMPQWSIVLLASMFDAVAFQGRTGAIQFYPRRIRLSHRAIKILPVPDRPMHAVDS
jgi:hypothetical protein